MKKVDVNRNYNGRQKKHFQKKQLLIQNCADTDNENNLVLTSYVVKKKSGKTDILLLSTMYDDARCHDERKRKKKPTTLAIMTRESWC